MVRGVHTAQYTGVGTDKAQSVSVKQTYSMKYKVEEQEEQPKESIRTRMSF